MDRLMFSPSTAMHGQMESGILMFSVPTWQVARRMNQDRYHTATYDGLLLECTHIADGTEVEFYH